VRRQLTLLPIPISGLTSSSYTLLAAVSTFFVGSWLGIRVSGFRKAAKVPYPYEYASYEQVQTAAPAHAKAMDTFNRAQRGHQNFNENHTATVAALLISGLTYPTAAAALGFFWSVNRVLYAVGYTNGGEKGRYWGIGGLLTGHVLNFMAARSAWVIANA
jgi:glutathione S-transferase